MLIIDVHPGETEEQAEARIRSAPKQPPKNAVHSNMDRADYDRLDRVNWSRLKNILRSPAHYRHGLLEARPDTDAFKRGRCVHLAVLEPERFAVECAVWRGGRRAGKEWERFVEGNSDREILTEAERDLCVALNSAVRANPDAARYLADGRSEVTVTWEASAPPLGEDEGWRFACKGRLDYLSPLAIVDLKTTRDASPDGFGREAWRYRYDAQAAFYVDGYEAATGQRLPYVLIAVEVAAPHVVQVYRVKDEILDVGRDAYRSALGRLAECRRSNSWGGYAEGEMALTLPGWAVPRLDDEDVSEMDLVIGD